MLKDLPWNLSVISDEIDPKDFEHALRVISELGAPFVEVRNLWGKNVTQLSDQEFSDMRALVSKYGLRISNLDSPTFKIYIGDEKSYDQHLKVLRRVIELSKRLDLSYTRIFTFWYQGELEDYIATLQEKFGPGCGHRLKRGITLVIENEYSCLVGTGRETRAFLDRLRTKWVQTLWDPGNAFFARETPYPKGYEAVKDTIMHVHIKDAAVDNGHFVWRPVGKGMIDYRGQFKAMKGKPYVISLETHYRAPSGNLEESTRESFQGILSVIKGL